MDVAGFRAAMPAFASAPDDATINRWIARSVPYFDIDIWDTFYPDGVCYWIAHNIVLEAFLGNTLATAGGSLDAIGKRVGSVSVNYSDKIIELKAKDPYMRTIYGQEYRRLQKLIGTGLATAV